MSDITKLLKGKFHSITQHMSASDKNLKISHDLLPEPYKTCEGSHFETEEQ